MPRTRDHRPAVRRLLLAVWVVTLTLPVSAGMQVKRFYAEKEQATSPEAFVRARERLRPLVVGMSEAAFLAAMRMRVLTKAKQPYDALLEGYLHGSSDRANQIGRGRGERHLVLGFIADGAEIPQVDVVLRDKKVIAIEWLEHAPPLVTATSSAKLFYRAKGKSTSAEAFERAEARLAWVEEGMPEMQFLDTVHMQILAKGTKPVDAFVEGYLAEASKTANQTGVAGPATDATDAEANDGEANDGEANDDIADDDAIGGDAAGGGQGRVRRMVFGFAVGKRDEPRIVVTLVNGRVKSVERWRGSR